MAMRSFFGTLARTALYGALTIYVYTDYVLQTVLPTPIYKAAVNTFWGCLLAGC